MLTSLVTELQTLVSKYFVIGAFVPVLAFAFINGVLLYVEFDWFHAWASSQITGTARAFDVAAVGIGLAVVAYVLWGVSAFLIRVLEGRHLSPDSWLGKTLSAIQLQRFRDLRGKYFEARNSTLEIARLTAPWTNTLIDASTQGLNKKDAQGQDIPNPTNDYDGVTGPAATALAALRQQRVDGDDIPVADLRAAVNALATELRTNNIRVPHPTAGTILQDDRRDLLTIIEYAKDRWQAREVSLANQLQWRFGVRDIAPTAFGNVAAALENYGLTRYGINLPTFWSRLLTVLQAEKDYLTVIEDAKVQLNFLVSCCWLAVFTTATWAVVLLARGSSISRFVITMIAGPILVRICYVAAVENYVAFGEVVRSAVDLRRLKLLEALHIQRPTSLRDERRVWEALQRVTTYGQETVDISYQFPPEPHA
jgi:hypothetical protein